MTVEIPAPPVEAASPPELSPLRQATVREAAQVLGADASTATRLAASEIVVVQGYALGIDALSRAEAGPWLATVQAPRPAGVPERVWHDALLLANGQALALGPWAFGVNDGGDGVLLMKLPIEAQDDAGYLAALLHGLVNLCASVVEATLALPHLEPTEGVST